LQSFHLPWVFTLDRAPLVCVIFQPAIDD